MLTIITKPVHKIRARFPDAIFAVHWYPVSSIGFLSTSTTPTQGIKLDPKELEAPFSCLLCARPDGFVDIFTIDSVSEVGYQFGKWSWFDIGVSITTDWHYCPWTCWEGKNWKLHIDLLLQGNKWQYEKIWQFICAVETMAKSWLRTSRNKWKRA